MTVQNSQPNNADAAHHKTIPVQVWADVDEGVAELVTRLNTIPGIRTHASCQGTISEGGADPYGPHVMASWQDDEALSRLSRFKVEKLGDNFGYVTERP